MDKKLALKIFEGFSIQRWNDLVRPFELVEMDKAGEKMILAYIIGKYEEKNGKKIDWNWMIYASVFDLLKKIALCDIKAPVQQMLKREFPQEYMRLNEWVLNQYKSLITDEELFSKFTIYIGQKAGSFSLPQALKNSLHVIILNIDGNRIGIIIDKVARVVTVKGDEVKDPPQMISGIGSEYIEGVIRQDDIYLIMLNIRKLFNAKELQKIIDNQ